LAFVASIAGVVSINGPISGRDSLERFQPGGGHCACPKLQREALTHERVKLSRVSAPHLRRCEARFQSLDPVASA
jgi:hypothetical protein